MFSLQEISRLSSEGYEVELPKTAFDTQTAVESIKIIGEAPKIIGWAGPARSGTTSLLFLLAGHEQVSKVFFQPIKTILRKGSPSFHLSGADGTICLKEVFRGCCPANDHDPIKILLKSGVPPQNISWITMLREPLQNYASWTQHIAGCTPDDYAITQEYTIKIYNYYKKLGLNIVPFAYDLLAMGESTVVDALLKKMGISLLRGLDFKKDFINKKTAYGQAEDPNYFKMSVQPTLEREKFIYTTNSTRLSDADAQKINRLCKQRYDDFYELSRAELGINLQDC